ncbi:pseudoazurin [Pelagibacterium halotolerans]|uniref:pseudoazurin n=1 Tax=Pelagibacterium halotolerans TaxID=531813 RepID=UPI00384FA830
MKKPIALALATALAAATVPALAEDFEVQMLNRGEAGVMIFEPAALKIEPGDTVTFVATDPGHNAETIPGMWPEGAEPLRTALGETVTVTFDAPGVYGIKCAPHYAMGMVALIQVGDAPANLDEAKSVSTPPVAAQRYETAYAALGL